MLKSHYGFLQTLVSKQLWVPVCFPWNETRPCATFSLKFRYSKQITIREDSSASEVVIDFTLQDLEGGY